MKYIRTKDGRIIDLKNWAIIDTICVDTETNKSEKDICYQRSWFNYYGDTCEYKTEYISHNNQVLKQADTVEELCDEFVVYVKDNIKMVRIFPKGKAMEYSTYLKRTDNLDSEIYGAIYTDKGLIYVAKMNDEGELELL